jgi:hypothetical protein
MIKYIDEEEREIIESLYSDGWVSDFDDVVKKFYEDSAIFHIENTRQVNVNLPVKEFLDLKNKANEVGVHIKRYCHY